MSKPILLYLFTLAGFLALLAATSALQATRWAVLRPLVLLIGLAWLLFRGLRLLYQAGLLPAPLRKGLIWAERALSSLARGLFFDFHLGLACAGVIFALSGAFAVWYGSLGLFPRFPAVGNLYIDQAQAFLHGQLALEQPPSPEILALPDPYDYAARKDLPYLWDASLYRGSYYLYWGPVPALLLAGILALTGGPIPDPLMVILTTIGLSAVTFWLLWRVRCWAYPQAPPLSVGLFLMLVPLNLPVLFLLGRGRVYETSILTGQMFLFLGLAGYVGYTQSKRRAGLLLAGMGWGLAIACRYNLALSVAVFLAFALWAIWQPVFGHNNHQRMRRDEDAPGTGLPRRSARLTAFLLAPLALVMLGLGLFNALRFGSPFETGLNYQLTAPVYQNQHFSLDYLPASFYLSVLYPYRPVEGFPLIRSIAVEPQKAPAWAQFSPGKRVEETNYSLRLMPFLGLLALLPLAAGLAWRARREQAASPAIPTLDPVYPFPGLQLAGMVGLAGLLQFGLLLLYYYSAVRFMADYSPGFTLLTILTVWSLDGRLTRRPGLRALLWAVTTLTVALTALLGFLAGFDNPPQVFHIYNPALEAQIAAAWNTLWTSPGIVGKLLRYLLAPIL